MSRLGGTMAHSSHSRRHFIATTSVGLIGAATLPEIQNPPPTQEPTTPPAGAPPAFGAGPAVGPPVSANTFAEAGKLVQFELTPSERTVAADSWRSNRASLPIRNGIRFFLAAVQGPQKKALSARTPAQGLCRKKKKTSLTLR